MLRKDARPVRRRPPFKIFSAKTKRPFGLRHPANKSPPAPVAKKSLAPCSLKSGPKSRFKAVGIDSPPASRSKKISVRTREREIGQKDLQNLAWEAHYHLLKASCILLSTMGDSPPKQGSLPSVPSPVEAFPEYLTHLTSTLDQLTTYAAALPAKTDLNFARSIDRKFAKSLDSTSERVLSITERLLALVEEGQKTARGKDRGKGKPEIGRRKLEDQDDVVDGYRGAVLSVVDGLLEDADTNLDVLKGNKTLAAIHVKPELVAQAGKKLPGPFTERLPQNIMHASSLVKPQLLFHDRPDNVRTKEPWRPTLSSKPHSMVPLNFKIPLEYELTYEEEMDPSKAVWRKEKELRLRRHPYYYETKHLPYPTSMFIDSQPIQPQPFEQTPLEFVDTPEKLQKMVERLEDAKEIAVDLEHHDMRSYAGFTCLIQISTRDEDWVVDTLALRKEIREGKFGDVMSDPSIVKVFHGADSDIVWLQHDFDIYVVNMFDTYHASVVLGMQQRSLSSLLLLYCNFEADKRYQRADWRIRPLPESMLYYARSDTHFLLFIYDNLRNALLQKSSHALSPDAKDAPIVLSSAKQNPQAAMRNVLDRSADTALKLYERDAYDEETGRGSGGWLVSGKKWLPKGGIDQECGWIWRHLHEWRDRIAREQDESPFYILPQALLRDICLLPNTGGLAKVIRRDRTPVAANFLAEIASVFNKAKDSYEKFAAEQEAENHNVGIRQSKSDETAIPKRVVDHTVPVVPLVSDQHPPSSVWDIVPSTTTTRTATKSGLFGSTIKSTSAPSTTSVSLVTKKASGMFGETLSKDNHQKADQLARDKRELSPGFLAVMDSMRVGRPSATADEAQETDSKSLLRPESVPFVPASQRMPKSTLPPVLTPKDKAAEAPNTSTTPLPAPTSKTSETVEVNENGVVQVKRSKKQRKRERGSTTSATSDVKKFRLDDMGSSSAADTPSQSASPSPKSESALMADKVKTATSGNKKGKKPKVKPEDIPAFDYATQPNLLDQPQSFMGVDAEKVKKKKTQKPRGTSALEVPTFGARPAKDLSQPREGNKSGTFTSSKYQFSNR
ncbi:uncharacterized protein L203_101001 [Cryptococcus depauperatus CBS 7841]|uniref:3'-5' exonuclease domain-containing protein n=1 Tax=Cryptococcus depauperatus CBS 7841 TaxID=1295531 RepID=A0AAJ8JP93_9TREE